MNQVLFDLFDFRLSVCLYDILVFSHTKEDHVHDLSVAFKGLQKV